MNINFKRVKIFVTIPVGKIDEIRKAICEAGAGVIGDYTECTFSTRGTCTFRPSDNANPYIGEQGKLEFVEEEKLEVICEVEKVKNVVKILREVHPYEEPAIDIIPLIDEEFFDNL